MRCVYGRHNTCKTTTTTTTAKPINAIYSNPHQRSNEANFLAFLLVIIGIKGSNYKRAGQKVTTIIAIGTTIALTTIIYQE